MHRSVASRNLAGGFFGGAIGILVTWYVAPMALPFGVLLGVVLGWWAEDLVKTTVSSYHTAVHFWQVLVQHVFPQEIRLPHRSFFGRLKTLITLSIKKAADSLSRVLWYVVLPFRWIARVLRACIHIPMRALRWASHPTSAARLITISAIIVGATINAAAFGMLWPWPETKTIGGGLSRQPVEVVPFDLVSILFITGIVTMFTTTFGLMGVIAESDENPTRDFYARWERYSRYSPTTYFIHELFRFFKSEVTVAIFLVLAVTYWLTLGGALLALLVVPVSTFVTCMVGLYKIAQRSAHWWCFGVTLAVTSISALIFYGSFGNEALLWTVALCAGTISGLATEALRRLGLWWSTTAMGEHYLGIWYDEDKVLFFSIGVPIWRKLLRAFDEVGGRIMRFAA